MVQPELSLRGVIPQGETEQQFARPELARVGRELHGWYKHGSCIRGWFSRNAAWDFTRVTSQCLKPVC